MMFSIRVITAVVLMAVAVLPFAQSLAGESEKKPLEIECVPPGYRPPIPPRERAPHVLYLYTSAVHAMNRKDFDTAMEDIKKAVAIDPNDTDVLRLRAACWLKKGETAKAFSDYNEAIKLEPNDSTSYYSRALFWATQNQTRNAINDCNEAIRLSPTDYKPFRLRGYSWLAQKDYEKALADFNEAIRLKPNDPRLVVCRGQAHHMKGDYGKANDDYRQAVTLSSLDSRELDAAAWFWATCKDEPSRDGRKAVESANRACEQTRWNRRRELETLAAAYAECGEFAKAIEWQSKANTMSKNEVQRSEGETRLTLYRSAKPYRAEPDEIR